MSSAKQIYIWGCSFSLAKIIWGYTEDPKSFQREKRKNRSKTKHQESEWHLGSHQRHWILEDHEHLLSKQWDAWLSQ